jgi:hypothetical protein
MSAKRPLVRNPGRVTFVVVVVLIILNLAIVALTRADTDQPADRARPTAVESVSPGPSQIASPSDTVTVDLGDTLTGVLLIDGAEVPEDQLDRVEPLGQVSFRPGPDKDLVRFAPGDHTVAVHYWSQGKNRPAEPSIYSWRFRVGA